MLTKGNSTASMNDFNSYLESMYNKGSTKYDIVFFENSVLKNFDLYFLDLVEWLTEDHINMYDSQIISNQCTVNGKLVGLVR